ncbi:chemotaxis protein CheA [Geobacter pelophilus]|jgi:two-component system chemotaxis sensor kinase CheA|uniref:histidine kinase n=1 Tax=Geoanaerobacter pelophilus TaxID=60036 RepID=A0AAW4L622_9BACT|nr:chemotaxis protein CheA [Geoanaerobacter pelophilus]MBT0664015.1 chemotaxis protein CheA [Geoanaerobacter pelophilus]
MDMSQYRELFLAEAREHLQTLNGMIAALEEVPGDQEKINALFRSAHSLKGMAASMEYGQIADLAHRMEDLMTRVRSGEFPFSSEIAALLLEGADLVALLLDDVETQRPFSADIGPISERLASFSPTTVPAEAPPLLEPVVAAKPVQQVTDAVPEPIHTVRVRTEILDRLIDTTGELFTSKHRLLNITQGVEAPRLKETLNDLGKLLRELHQTVMQARLMPFATLAERFPRVVRDLARKQGKEISFVVEGKEIELDRGVLEELADPLLHILRNAVDHGIESTEARLLAGKKTVGRIRLAVRREKDQAVIVVEDDGRGMDPDALVASAVAKGLLTAEQGAQLAPEEALMLTCLAGFSTAAQVTDVSGRGVGMDAVRATVQTLGGSLAISSEPGSGSRMTLRLPLNIAIINVLLIGTGGFKMAIPVNAVLRTLEITKEQILVRERRAYLLLDDAEIPLLSLNRIIRAPGKSPMSGFIPVIVTMIKGKLVGLIVDRVIGHREIHVKPVGRPLSRLRGLAGGGILGDGEIVFVLDPATLL